MPRLTTQSYLSRHYQLKQLWTYGQHWFVNLSYKDQIALHTYYLPSVEKSKAELSAHHRNVRIGDPSLPQRAGRAYAKLVRGEVQLRRSTKSAMDGRQITVRAIARPEPDLRMLSNAAWRIALRVAHEDEVRRKLSRCAIHASGLPQVDAA